MAWVRTWLCELHEGCTRLTTDKVYQLLAHGRLFSPHTPASSTTKTGRHDIAEILLKVAIKHQKSNQINSCSKIVQSEHCVCWIMIGCFVRAGTWNFYSSVLFRMACYHYHCLCWIMIGCFVRAGTHNLYSGVLSRMACYHYHFLWSLYCAHSFLICLFVVFSYLYWSLIVFFLNVNFAAVPSIFYFSLI